MWVKQCEYCNKENNIGNIQCTSCGKSLDHAQFRSNHSLFSRTKKELKRERKKQGKGIAGWLTVILFIIILSTANQIKIVFNEYLPVFTSGMWKEYLDINSPDYSPYYFFLTIFEAISYSIIILFSLFNIILFLMRKRIVPKLMVIFFSSVLVFVLIDYFLVTNLLLLNESDKISDLTQASITATHCLVWSAYFYFSKRVKETFVV